MVLASVLALILNLAVLYFALWMALGIALFRYVLCLCSNSLMELSGFNSNSLKES